MNEADSIPLGGGGYDLWHVKVILTPWIPSGLNPWRTTTLWPIHSKFCCEASTCSKCLRKKRKVEGKCKAEEMPRASPLQLKRTFVLCSLFIHIHFTLTLYTVCCMLYRGCVVSAVKQSIFFPPLFPQLFSDLFLFGR